MIQFVNEESRRTYERSARLLLLMAMNDVMPEAKVRFEHSIKNGIYMRISGVSMSSTRVRRIEDRMRELVQMDIPIVKYRWTRNQAIDYFREKSQMDTVGLLKYRSYEFFDIYTCNGYSEYFYGEMAESTGTITSFALRLLYPGMVLILPGRDGKMINQYIDSPKLMRAFSESKDSLAILNCQNVAELNEIIIKGKGKEFIRVSEAIHSRHLADISERIVDSGARVVFISGPSSSGKTTFARRLGVELRVCGKYPFFISIDNYYHDRANIPVRQDGTRDLECIESIDTSLFNEHLVSLMAGNKVEIPIFSFVTKERVRGEIVQIGADDILIVEGIHGLNPILGMEIPGELKYRVYVSELTALNLDNHNRIRTTDVRLLRRLVRDVRTREASFDETLSMWESVRNGEEEYIFPYQEQADVVFNSSLPYEVSVLKKYAYPLLKAISKESTNYTISRRLIKFLNYFEECGDENEIPPTSILREFIGKCSFYDEL